MLLFCAKQMNWSLHSNWDWQSTLWEINRDGTYHYFCDNGYKIVPDTLEEVPEIYEHNGTMDNDAFEKLNDFLENEFTDASRWHEEACDGIGWKMIFFDEQEKPVCTFTGYIYNSEPLQRLAKMLP